MPQEFSLTGNRCIIAHLVNKDRVKSFLLYCCIEAQLEIKGDPAVTLHEKKTVPEASGLGGNQNLKKGGKIGVGTFPRLARNNGFVMVTVSLPIEVENFQKIVETGIQNYFGALNVVPG